MAKNLEKLAAKEQRELTRLRKKRSKPAYAGYLLVLCVIIIFIHISDEITTNIGAYVQSSVVTEFLAKPLGISYTDALGTYSSMTMLIGMFSFIAPFYKSLADVLGRKPFLCLNMVGMAIGLVLCWWSPSIYVYIVGYALCQFFIQHDLQVVYIFEVAPPEKRATIYGITKCLGTIGLVIVPILRDQLMGNDATLWRSIFLLPVIIALAASVCAFVFMRESEVYIDSRIEHLETPLEERLAKKEAKKKEEKENKAGVFRAIGYVLRNKELRWLAIAYIVYYVAVSAMSSYYESIMTNYGMSTEAVTQALMVYPFVFAAIVLIFGFIGDKLGRKAVAVIGGLCALLGFAAFNFAAKNGISPYIVGTLYGIYLGGFWQGGDYMNMMAAEKAPTEIRSSVLGGMGLLMMIGAMLGGVGVTVGFFFANSVGLVCMMVAIPAVVIGVGILLAKVKDTKGADLTTAGKVTAE